MSQRVDYEAMPGTRYDQYVPKLMNILRFAVTEEGAKFKPFRDFVRKQGVWDKEKGPRIFSLVDVDWDRKAVRVGALGRKLLAAGGDEAVKDLLFQRLADDNILLVKYVLEALDVESGGRLHSVHELYRMVTSYVYPGEYVALPSFQAWIEWLAATGYIRMIGIRWGLSDTGLKILPEYQAMDIEEILEDMEEEEDEDDEDDVDDLLPPAFDAPPDAATPAPVAQDGMHEDMHEDDDEDDLLDGLPGSPPSSAGAPEPGSQAGPATDAPAPAESQPAAPAKAIPTVAPVVSAPAVPQPSVAVAPREPMPGAGVPRAAALVTATADLTELVARANEWYALWNRWPRLTAAIAGVDTGPEGTEGDTLLLELGVLATLVEGVPLQPQLLAALQRIRQSGFFARLAAEDGGFGDAMDALGDTDSQPWLRAFLERLIHARAMRARLDAKPGLMDRLYSAGSGAEAVRLLRDELFGGGGHEAPFWVVRELVRDGMLDGVTFADATVVPTARLLTNAARVGIIPRADVTSFAELAEASAAVAAHFGAESGYGEALEVLDRGLDVTSSWL